MRTRESEGERQGGAWRLRGVEEEAGGGQGKQEVAGASRARATPRSFWRGGRRQGEALGWAAGGAGPGGLRGVRQVSFLSSLLLFLFNSVFYFL